jgi:23S rRNA (adenine2503-C2)-methyltransferase
MVACNDRAMDLTLLEETLAARGEPSFRAAQVWRWAAAGAQGYEAMTNLPRTLREDLAREVPFSSLGVRREARARDGTVKTLFATADGRPLEAVLMRYRSPPGGGNPPGGGAGRNGDAGRFGDTSEASVSRIGRRRVSPCFGRRSICLSSQSGCPLTCTFCATGKMQFARNLTTSEILDQALHFRRVERVDHCVFMGMGEPLLNLDAVLAACERLPDLGIGHRRIAVSTVGWIPGIERLTACELPLRLALSLHAADEALRSELMPVNERYPLSEVIEACRAHYARKRRRIFVEYVMLAGVNDRYEQAVALAKLLTPERRASAHPVGGISSPGGRTRGTIKEEDARDPQMFKVNLIPYNPTDSPYKGSSRGAIAAFKTALEEHGVQTTVRLTRGRDIDAACGQLAVAAA